MKFSFRGLRIAVLCLACSFAGFIVGGKMAGRNRDLMMQEGAANQLLSLINQMAFYHAGKQDRATQIWEGAIDNAILAMHQNMRAESFIASNPSTIEAMQVAQAYRAKYPSTGAAGKLAGAALADVAPFKGDERLLQAKCNGPVCQIIREYATSETLRRAGQGANAPY